MLPQAGQSRFTMPSQFLGLIGRGLSLAQFAREQGQHGLAFALALGLNTLEQRGIICLYGEARPQISQLLARIFVGGAQLTHIPAERFSAAALLRRLARGIVGARLDFGEFLPQPLNLGRLIGRLAGALIDQGKPLRCPGCRAAAGSRPLESAGTRR